MIPSRLDRQQAAVLIVDLQEKLLPAMTEREACVAAAARLISAAGVLGVEVVAAEQYPAGLGATCGPVKALLSGRRIYEKVVFSACVPEVLASLGRFGQIIVAGIEAHVCVQQTVLDLLRDGKEVWVCADAVTSRRALDRDIALQTMRQAGAWVTTTESVIFGLLGEAGTAQFKQILRIVK